MTDQPPQAVVLPLPLPSADRVRSRGRDATGGSQRCTATSKASGVQCRNMAVTGATVCASHGAARGTAARAAADRRVAEAYADRMARLTDLALDRIEGILEDPEDDKVGLAAAKDVLDRAGYGAVKKHEVGAPGTFASVDDEIERILSQGQSRAS